MILLLLSACTPSEPDAQVVDTQDSGAPECRALSQDRVHTVVAGQPFGPDPTRWLSFALEGGSLRETGGFNMGVGTFGRVSWTPDGRVGAVAQSDGSVGIFGAEQGQVQVIEASFSGEFYASNVHFDASGGTLWIVDGNWVNNGGGLYKVAIDCETGAPGQVEFVRESKLATALLMGERTLLVAHEVDGQSGYSAYELEGPEGEVLGGIELFDYPDYVVFDAVMGTGGDVWVAEVSTWSGQPTQVAVLDADLQLRGRAEITDPVAVVPAPQGGSALVLSAYKGDALLLLDQDLSTQNVQYSALPWAAAGVPLGPDAGAVVVTENQALVALQFQDGGVQQTDRWALTGDAIPGTVGVSP